MNVAEVAAWGGQALILKLPALVIKLSGLSHYQHDTLVAEYSGFVSPNAMSADIDCQVYRLPGLPKITAAELTINGQYAPRKRFNKATALFSIIGANFKADFTLQNDWKSSLGVLNEAELAHGNVIENYLRIISAHRVLSHKGVVLHSAGLVFDDSAYIFSGRSNAGKTTLTRKAHRVGARVLSDDINLVLPGKAGYEAFAVPFTGEFGRTLDHEGGKESYRLTGIVLLEQGDRLQALPISESLAVARLLSGSPFVNTDEGESEALFEAVTGLVSSTPVIRLLNRREDKIDDIMTEVRRQFAEL